MAISDNNSAGTIYFTQKQDVVVHFRLFGAIPDSFRRFAHLMDFDLRPYHEESRDPEQRSCGGSQQWLIDKKGRLRFRNTWKPGQSEDPQNHEDVRTWPIFKLLARRDQETPSQAHYRYTYMMGNNNLRTIHDQFCFIDDDR
jgi:hypothetical protein